MISKVEVAITMLITIILTVHASTLRKALLTAHNHAGDAAQYELQELLLRMSWVSLVSKYPPATLLVCLKPAVLHSLHFQLFRAASINFL